MSEKVIKKLQDLQLEDSDQLEFLQDKCGIFGCIANGEWPTNLDVAHIICLGLVGLQHRSQSINPLTVLY
jgi:amidophosphoribosyltransferase